jgi:hypothetical protein
MSFSLEGHEKHYLKLACGGVELGENDRVSSLSGTIARVSYLVLILI